MSCNVTANNSDREKFFFSIPKWFFPGKVLGSSGAFWDEFWLRFTYYFDAWSCMKTSLICLLYWSPKFCPDIWWEAIKNRHMEFAWMNTKSYYFIQNRHWHSVTLLPKYASASTWKFHRVTVFKIFIIDNLCLLGKTTAPRRWRALIFFKTSIVHPNNSGIVFFVR